MSEASAKKRARMEERHSQPYQILHSWSRYDSTVIQLKHTWIIPNFTLLPHNRGEKLYSSIFSDPSENKMEWQLQLYPKGENEESNNSISVFLWLNNPQLGCKFYATHKFMLLNKKRRLLLVREHFQPKNLLE